MTTTADLISYYEGLLIIQYANKERAKATVGLLVSQVIADQIIQQVQDGFNVETAVGAQLDKIATYRGAEREIFGLDLNRKYFTMPRAGNPGADMAMGFQEVGGTPATWFFLTLRDVNQPIYALTDDELRRLIKFRAKVQSSDFGLKSLDAILEEFFGDNVGLYDNEDMSITYIDLISDPDTLFNIANKTKSLPRPAGVLATAFRSETLTNFFGFQRAGQANNPTFVGFSEVGSPTTGSFIRIP